MKNLIFENFKSFFQGYLSSHNQFPHSNADDAYYYVFALRDQRLYAFFIGASNNSLFIHNSLYMEVPVMTIGAEGVLRPDLLSDQLRDIIAVFQYEYLRSSDKQVPEVPAIVILESSQFLINSINFTDNYSLLSKERGLSPLESKQIADQSPYIATDTLSMTFSLTDLPIIGNDISDYLTNVIYTRSTYLNSWINVLKSANLTVAYLGPLCVPLVFSLGRLDNEFSIFVDIQKLSSRIYVISSKNSLFEYPFPFGYGQFTDPGADHFNIGLLVLRIRRSLSQQDLDKAICSAPIYFSGLPYAVPDKDLDSRVNPSAVNHLFDQFKYKSVSLKSDSLPLDQITKELACSAFLISGAL